MAGSPPKLTTFEAPVTNEPDMGKMSLLKGDITLLAVDAVVNAANSPLMGGGGVDGAIHRAGGPEILQACREIVDRQGRLPTGEAVATTAGKLPAKFVIHTVGPVWRSAEAEALDELLCNCYRNSLTLASQLGLSTVAFPNISTGVYGYPKPRAASLAISATRTYLTGDPSIGEVTFVCFDDENFHLYESLLNHP